MQLSFFGAAKCVTGSNYLLEIADKRIVIDCGFFQGDLSLEAFNDKPFSYDPSTIDAVILTHAHIDHSGKLPKLVKDGFKGKIYCSYPTRDLCDVLLMDAAKIQEFDATWENKKRQRAGLCSIDPLYNEDDVYNTRSMFYPINIGQEKIIEGDITLTLTHTGHLLGACSATLKAEGKTITFSGDLGTGNPILLTPGTAPIKSDIVICESTYGNRTHPASDARITDLINALTTTLQKGGTAIIPAFSVGRTQQILFDIYTYTQKNPGALIKKYPIYVDSPLAINATDIYAKNMRHLKPELTRILEKGDLPFAPDNLKIIRENSRSIALNRDENPKVIISASGMCDAGRVQHHLKHYLWKPTTSIIFVGYQAENSRGRKILDGEPTIEFLKEKIANKATVYTLSGYSGHGDQLDLINWIKASAPSQKIILSHGEPDSINALKEKVSHYANVITPAIGDTIEL